MDAWYLSGVSSSPICGWLWIKIFFRVANNWRFWCGSSFDAFWFGAFTFSVYGSRKWRFGNVEIIRNKGFRIGWREVLFGEIGEYWIFRLNYTRPCCCLLCPPPTTLAFKQVLLFLPTLLDLSVYLSKQQSPIRSVPKLPLSFQKKNHPQLSQREDNHKSNGQATRLMNTYQAPRYTLGYIISHIISFKFREYILELIYKMCDHSCNKITTYSFLQCFNLSGCF